MYDIGLIVVGLAGLLVGGELLVRGATVIAKTFGMSSLIIGLTVVSIGTSAPELAICLDSAFKDKPEIALGNVLGSNIANVLLILGITALVMPIAIHKKIVQREVPIMIGVSVLFSALAIDGLISFWDGVILLATMVGFLLFQFGMVRQAKKQRVAKEKAEKAEKADKLRLAIEGTDSKTEHSEADMDEAKSADRQKSGIAVEMLLSVFTLIIGVSLLWLGAGWMVKGASNFAEAMGVSQLVIGLTIVALGSSAPEIVTSLVAAFRGHAEMAVGNVIGSNVSNIALVMGATATVSDGVVVPSPAMQFEFPVLLASAIACLPIFARGNRIDRWEGVLFILSFFAFLGCLYVRSSEQYSFPRMNAMAWRITLPLVAVTMIIVILRILKKRKSLSNGD